MKPKIGFIGLGIMGKPMSKNLIKKGYSLKVYDIRPEPVEDIVKYGAEKGQSPKDVAAESEVIITMLPNSPHVKEAVLGENGVIEGARPGTILIDMSSIDPGVSKEIAEKVSEKGIIMFDAPVSGGEPKAIDGTLSIMVGGPEKEYGKIKDILLAMGSSVTLVGEIGSGNVVKLANQIIVALNIAAVSEALLFTTKAGVEPEKVYQAIRGGLAGSTVLEAKFPMIVERNFKPGFRIDLHIKDLMNAVNMSHQIGAPLFLSQQVLEMMKNLKFKGKGSNDHSDIVEFYEELANVEVKSFSK